MIMQNMPMAGALSIYAILHVYIIQTSGTSLSLSQALLWTLGP